MNPKDYTIFKNQMIQIQASEFCIPAAWDIEQAQRVLRKEITVHYFDAGRTTLIVGSNEITAKPGDIVVVNPYEFHSVIRHEGTQSDRYYTISVDSDFILRMKEGLPESRYLLLTSGIQAGNYFDESHQLAYLIRVIVSEVKKQRLGHYASLQDIMHRFFALLLKDSLKTPDDDVPKEKIMKYCQIISPALEAIRREYSSNLTADSLADLCGVSKFHFCRIFKLVTGISPIQYLLHYRLQIAQAMLINSDTAVAEIALACGFEDVCYFCRAYKKQFCVSAQKYRLRYVHLKTKSAPASHPEEALIGIG